jgi:branched-chain amino acid transport system ATP-binding protein
LWITILLVEQKIEHALQISDYAYVLENGEIIMAGGAEDLMNSDMVRRVYLGM